MKSHFRILDLQYLSGHFPGSVTTGRAATSKIPGWTGNSTNVGIL